jgi:DNA-binding CsgD family transcriptional regulator
MSVEADGLVAAGHAALGAGDWPAAKSSFEAALEREEAAETLAGLSDALWWLGDSKAAVRCAERAYAGFRRRPDPVRAAFAAISLYFLYRISLGNTAASRGWLGRLARLVEDFGLAPLAGWVLLICAHDTDDPAAAEDWACQARELARRFADSDLELCALSQLGASLVQTGRMAEGTALLDEAMAASLGGECQRLQTVVYACCNMISSCSQVADLGRATQWIRAADDFTRRYGCPHLYTHCRAYYGSVLYTTGDWAGAERELRAALRVGRSAERALYGQAVARLAELRLAQGRIEEAERLIEGFEDHYTSARVLAALRLARGDPASAARILSRRMHEVDEHERERTSPYQAGAAPCLGAAALLELLTETEIERGDAQSALASARRLEDLGGVSGCESIVACAERALGRVLCASGDAVAALPHLERAVSIFGRLEIPFEAARTRLLLARTSGLGERDTAVAEARAALAAFEALGAARDADAATGLLRSLGVKAARSGARGPSELTRRELEVLELLGEGLSNRELAERLFLTRKTVEHHVRSVLSKLGLRSRAEAAAYAVRHLERDSATKWRQAPNGSGRGGTAGSAVRG